MWSLTFYYRKLRYEKFLPAYMILMKTNAAIFSLI
ncbi:MAG: hypothetical protein BWY89_01284 [Bacteroidetes bacterium ADurb.BinA012]|nr:MAG: hypothetical protein BWY89_01284 [Bacteroidetes bacterium ADurb.BinA012]